MNKKQRLVIMVAGVLMFLMLIYPPFYFDNGERIINVGYGFIFSPPHEVSNVNTSLLFIQWITLATCGGIAWLLLRREK